MQVHILNVNHQYRDGSTRKMDDYFFSDKDKAIAYARKLTGDSAATDYHFVSAWRSNQLNSMLDEIEPAPREFRIIVTINSVDTLDDRI